MSDWKPDKALVRQAKKLIGQRAWLCGGGQFANSVILVKVLGVDKGYAQLESGDAKLDSVLLCSWYLVGIADWVLKGLKKVKNGQYYFTSNATSLHLFKKGFLSAKSTFSKTIVKPA